MIQRMIRFMKSYFMRLRVYKVYENFFVIKYIHLQNVNFNAINKCE
jgi:hypothetical protein